nr:hypothetical protein [Tanacetum cinerariifolium]
MVKISSSSENEPCCSKACKKNTESLNSKITELTDKLFDAKNMIYHCKLRLAQVEARLVEHKDRELKYCGKIRGLKFQTESSADCIESLKKELELIEKEKEGLDSKLTGFQTALKDLDNLLESQRLDKNKEELGYKFADDTITDYIRPAPTVESSPDDVQKRNPSVTVTEASPCTISPKPFIKFVKAADCTEVKTNKVEAARKASVRYAEMYKRTSKSPNVRGNQRNWNNLKSQQLGNNFVMKKKAYFNCGDFDHLAYDYAIRVKKGRTCLTNSHKTISPRTVIHKPHRPSMRPVIPNMNNARPQTTQDLMFIFIQRVKMLEKELKARTLPTKVHKVNRGAKLEDAMRTKRSRGVVDYILQVKKKVLTKKLNCRCSIKFRGGLLGLRSISFKKLDCRCSIKFRGGLLGIKCFKPFPLLVHFSTASKDKFPLLNSHC